MSTLGLLTYFRFGWGNFTLSFDFFCIIFDDFFLIHIFLERMPVSQIDWPVDNFDRIDRFTDPYLDRWNRTSVRATQPFFKDESTYLQWNADPFYYGNFLLKFWH